MIEHGLEWHSLDSYFSFTELSAAPVTPEPNHIRLYAKDAAGISTLCFLNDAGVEQCFPTNGSLISGTGVAGQVAFFTAAHTLAGDADLTFSTDTLTATKLAISSMTLGSVLFAGTAGLVSQDNTNFFWDDTNDRLGLGINASLLSKLHISSNSASPDAIIHADHYSTSVNAGFRGRTARGTKASPTATQTDDALATFTGIGFGSSFNSSADGGFFIKAGEVFVSTTSKGTYLTLETTPLVSATRAERWRVQPGGRLANATGHTAVYDLISSGHSALEYLNHGSVSTLTVSKAQDALTIVGTLSTTTTSPDQRNLNGIYIEMVDADNGTGDHRVRPILALVQTSATAGLIGHKAAAIQGTAQATGSSNADLAGVTGETIAISSTTAGHAWSFLATQAGVANKAIGLYFGDTGNSWYRGIDFTNATGFSDTAILLATNATAGKIAWAGGGDIGSSSNNVIWLGSSSVCSINVGSGSQGFALVTSRTSGASINHTGTQTQPNAGDTGDAMYSAGFTLSANSATNELVTRAFTLSLTNTLTGGGHMQNARLMDLAATVSLNATIDTLSYIFLNAPAKTGTLTTTIGIDGGSLANTDFLFKVATDNTDPTGGGGAATGRIKIQDAAGNTRYIPYY